MTVALQPLGFLGTEGRCVNKPYMAGGRAAGDGDSRCSAGVMLSKVMSSPSRRQAWYMDYH